MSPILANFEEEREAFYNLLNNDVENRILTIHGESGTGKTSLLNACIETVPDTIQHVALNCKGSTVNVSEVFSRTIFTLSWDFFPNFVDAVAELSGTVHVNVDGNKLLGINNTINVALKSESKVDREERRVTLTNAWFQDLAELEKMLLISIDTFEQATSETSEWFSGPFLYRAAYTRNLRVLIAGQTVPDHQEHANEWGHCCSPFQLVGVKEARFWLPVVNKLGYRVPAENSLDFMAGICHVLKGRPAEIMKIIEGFPRQADE